MLSPRNPTSTETEPQLHFLKLVCNFWFGSFLLFHPHMVYWDLSCDSCTYSVTDATWNVAKAPAYYMELWFDWLVSPWIHPGCILLPKFVFCGSNCLVTTTVPQIQFVLLQCRFGISHDSLMTIVADYNNLWLTDYTLKESFQFLYEGTNPKIHTLHHQLPFIIFYKAALQ